MTRKKKSRKDNLDAKFKSSRTSQGIGSFGDVLSPAEKLSLQSLRKNLTQKSETTIKAQLDRSQPPWHSHGSESESGEPSPKFIDLFGYSTTYYKSEPQSPELPNRSQKQGPQKQPTSRVRKTPRALGKPRSAKKSHTTDDNTFLLNKPKTPSSKIAVDAATRRTQATVSGKTGTREQPFQFWDLPPDATVREEPPRTISLESRAEFDRFVSNGVSVAPDVSGEQLWVVIGLDFGTSCTKVICRMPYEPEQPTIAIPAPTYLRSDGHPYLWQTVVWANKDVFSPYPEPGTISIQNLKQGLMSNASNSSANHPDSQKGGVSPLDTATAYLTYVIRYVRGWLTIECPELFRGRQPLWFVNLGLAAANYDNKDLFQRYRTAGATAMMLANSGDAVSIEAIRIFQEHKAVVEAAESDDGAEKLGIAIIPETAAAATGFAKSPGRPLGLYLMVDVGAMTLDVCTFRLNKRRAGPDQYHLLEVDVRPLGVEAFYRFLEMDRTEKEFRRQCDRCVGEVVRETKENRDPSAECWKTGNELPVFFTGGGSNNSLHKAVIKGLAQRLRTDTTRTDGIRLLDLPVPNMVNLPERIDDLSRMTVAFGLCYLPTEIGKITPPSATEDILRRKANDYSDRFVSKDKV